MTNIDFNVFLLKWNIEAVTGYKPQTTFWSDFSIAEVFGKDDPDKGVAAVQDTYDRAFEEWKSNVVYITELVLVLNHKIWFWWDVSQKSKDPLTQSRRPHSGTSFICDYADKLSHLYNSLWEKTDEWCLDNLKGEDADYYFHTTD